MYQSIKNRDGTLVFVFDLSIILDICTDPFYYLTRLMEFVNVIEKEHPKVFKYRFNGKSIEVIARIPCNRPDLTSVFGRYGGPFKFYRILRKYLACLINANLKTNASPSSMIPLAIIMTGGKINKSGYRSTFIKPTDTARDILKKGRMPVFSDLNNLNMKYWIKQLNPDIMDYRKKVVIENPKPVDYEKYPPCIKNCMALKDKPPIVRHLLMKYLLLMHKREDAKGVLLGCLNGEERNKLETGGLEEQWTHAVNSLGYNMDPSCEEMKNEGLCTECKRVSPFEEV